MPTTLTPPRQRTTSLPLTALLPLTLGWVWTAAAIRLKSDFCFPGVFTHTCLIVSVSTTERTICQASRPASQLSSDWPVHVQSKIPLYLIARTAVISETAGLGDNSQTCTVEHEPTYHLFLNATFLQCPSSSTFDVRASKNKAGGCVNYSHGAA